MDGLFATDRVLQEVPLGRQLFDSLSLGFCELILLIALGTQVVDGLVQAKHFGLELRDISGLEACSDPLLALTQRGIKRVLLLELATQLSELALQIVDGRGGDSEATNAV